jgi:prophage maintenance system killer protein
LEELGKILSIVEQAKQQPELSDLDKNNFSEIAIRYASTFVLLSQFDSNSLETNDLSEKITAEIDYEEALQAIQILKKHQIVEQNKIELFGQEVDGKFKALLGNITQTFDGQYLYPTIEEQAAHLLYFVNKNHAFVDGNKRISAYMFLLFLEKNKHHLKKNKTVKINDNGLVTLTLLVAQSASEDKELIIKLILNLINTR